VKERTLLVCLHSQKVEVALEEEVEEGVAEGQVQRRGQKMLMLWMLQDPAEDRRWGDALRLKPWLGFCQSTSQPVAREGVGFKTPQRVPQGILCIMGSFWEHLDQGGICLGSHSLTAGRLCMSRSSTASSEASKAIFASSDPRLRKRMI
jgi:hypothetical protein